eukprot:5106125-Prymnesium_polylepis.1
MRAGTVVQICVADRGAEDDRAAAEWHGGVVVAVWRCGTFRVRVDIDNREEEGAWTEECTRPPARREPSRAANPPASRAAGKAPPRAQRAN